MFRKIYLYILIILFINGCSPMVNRPNMVLPKDKKYAVGTFINYTDTPMAGLKASSIVESILVNRGVDTIMLASSSDEIEDYKNQQKALESQKQKAVEQNANYLVTGAVQEWRYKTGIDAEPAVSYSIKIIDLRDNRVIFNGVGAESGLSFYSLGELAQELADKLVPKFI